MISLRPTIGSAEPARWDGGPDCGALRPNILLVEDEETLRRLIQLVLRNSGYNVLAAGRGDEALALSQRFAPRIHLVVSDLVLPETDGRQLARRLLEKRPDLRVLFISGHPLDSAGIDNQFHFLQKPFPPARLLDTVKQILAR